MNNNDFVQLQDFIFGWGHGQARIHLGKSFFDCEFQLPKGVKQADDLTAIDVFTNVKIVSGYIISNLTHDHRISQRIGIGDIKRMEAIDGGDPLVWASTPKKNA